MQRFHSNSLVVSGVVSFLLALLGATPALAATTPTLGFAQSYGALGNTFTNSTATTINGDLGYTTPPAVAASVSGTIHVADGSYNQAGIDQGTALGILNAETCDFNFGSATDLSLLPQPLTPGVYCVIGAVSVGTGGITLSGAGTYLFRSDGALNTAANSIVTLADGASACDIFWTPTQGTTLGANSTFAGTDIDAAGITVGSTATWTGRALAFGGTVTTDTDTLSVPTCAAPTTGSLTVEKDTIGGNGTFTFVSDIPGNPGFSITTSGGSGSETFSNLAPGTYHVTENSIAGWTTTDTECGAISVAAGAHATCAITNTSNSLLGEIRGTKYEDEDGDGSLKDCGNHQLAGVTIYLDLNNNGMLDAGEPSAITDSHGNYQFPNLPAGTYHVREVVQSGWKQTVPASGSYTITLLAGQISKKDDFGNFKLGTVSGMKFEDKNGNGKKDSGEGGLSGWTIQLKKAGSNALIASTVTDSNGKYSFSNVGPGEYEVREVQKSGWVQMTSNPANITLHSGDVSTNINFGNHYGKVKKGSGNSY